MRMTMSASSAGMASEPFAGLEVATVAGDTLRASIRVAGALEAHTVTLLSSVLRTHTMAGRRYLRVDLALASIEDDVVVEALVEAHHSVEKLGGMLVFENAGPNVVEAVRSATLFVRAAEH